MDSQCAYCSPSVRTTLEEVTLVPLRGGQLPRDGIHEQRPIRPVAPPTRKVFPNGADPDPGQATFSQPRAALSRYHDSNNSRGKRQGRLVETRGPFLDSVSTR